MESQAHIIKVFARSALEMANIPLDSILSYLKRDGYEGWLAVEQFGLENQYDGIVRSAEYLMKGEFNTWR